MQRICVFCGSKVGRQEVYADAARELGALMARQSLGLVYGGGNVGLMGILADAVLAAQGEVIGVIPQSLVDRELAHHGVTELKVVSSMHERKALMADLSDAFVALPGGYGTFEEYCEVLTWSQLGLHDKACGILNTAGYFEPLLALFDHAVREEFVSPKKRRLVVVANEPEELLDALRAYRPPAARRWIGPEQT